jgi:hypothetical protein
LKKKTLAAIASVTATTTLAKTHKLPITTTKKTLAFSAVTWKKQASRVAVQAKAVHDPH